MAESFDYLDDIINALENIIDAKDDMWEENYRCNYNHKALIRESRLGPAREDIKTALNRYIEDRAERIVYRILQERNLL